MAEMRKIKLWHTIRHDDYTATGIVDAGGLAIKMIKPTQGLAASQVGQVSEGILRTIRRCVKRKVARIKENVLRKLLESAV